MKEVTSRVSNVQAGLKFFLIGGQGVAGSNPAIPTIFPPNETNELALVAAAAVSAAVAPESSDSGCPDNRDKAFQFVGRCHSEMTRQTAQRIGGRNGHWVRCSFRNGCKTLGWFLLKVSWCRGMQESESYL